MRLLTISASVVGLALAAISPAMAADAAEGLKVHMAKCKTCHGPTGAGNPGMARALKVEIRDFASPEVQKKTDDQLKKDSRDGVGKMKPTAGLSDADLGNVVAYIRSLKK